MALSKSTQNPEIVDASWERRLEAKLDKLSTQLMDLAAQRLPMFDPLEAAIYWLEGYRPPPPPKLQQKRTKIVPRKVWDRDNWTCQHCGTHENLTVDHIMPASRGGSDELDNLQTLCGSCNSRKSNR